MSLQELGIKHKKLEKTLAATIRCNIKERKELQGIVDQLAQSVPKENVLGPAFCIYYFTSDAAEGFEVEVGFPVSQPAKIDDVETRTLPEREVLAFVHSGPIEDRRKNFGKLFGYTAEHGHVSDEYYQEIYLDSNNPEGNEIELHFVLHDWNGLLAMNVERVLGEKAKHEVMTGSNELTLESTLDERVYWIKGALERVEHLASDNQLYDIVSGCAHVFPKTLIAKLKAVYERTREETKDPMKAIDAVRDFMAESPGWPDQAPPRNGNIILSTKRPANPEAHKKATTDAERRKAYCFCPIVRNHLESGILPDTFCNCSSGWFRQQWEGVLGKQVPKIDIVKSILKGDDVCQFAIHLPIETK